MKAMTCAQRFRTRAARRPGVVAGVTVGATAEATEAEITAVAIPEEVTREGAATLAEEAIPEAAGILAVEAIPEAVDIPGVAAPAGETQRPTKPWSS
jgi:hypothetical protein